MEKRGLLWTIELFDCEGEMFIVLIGSVARSEFNYDSDIDICRIDSAYGVSRRKCWPLGPINYVDYDLNTFNKLYYSGSLFIYHILREGKLLYGEQIKWQKYIDDFRLKDDFSGELQKIKDNMGLFEDIDMFGGKHLSLYSNLYKLVKNYSIFYLADKKIFEFNKERAMRRIFGDHYNRLLIDAYNYFERGNEINNWDFDNSELAKTVLDFYVKKMKELQQW
jgi:predicted nucleotidyltransferase